MNQSIKLRNTWNFVEGKNGHLQYVPKKIQEVYLLRNYIKQSMGGSGTCVLYVGWPVAEV